MATLDDKLMGEKLHYYCSSSSESEDDDDDDGGGEKSPTPNGPAQPTLDGTRQWDGTSCNVHFDFFSFVGFPSTVLTF